MTRGTICILIIDTRSLLRDFLGTIIVDKCLFMFKQWEQLHIFTDICTLDVGKKWHAAQYLIIDTTGIDREITNYRYVVEILIKVFIIYLMNATGNAIH